MHNELTKVDIDQMKAELAHRQSLVPGLREEVRRTREYGDLSENDEYRCAKREYNKNKSRMRYLERMIETAVVITTDSAADAVGLFDKVEIYYPEDDESRTVRLVTTLRENHSAPAENDTPLLIVGAGNAGAWAVNLCKSKNQSFGRPICMVDDDLTKKNLRVQGVPVRGTISDIPELVRKHHILEIVIAIRCSESDVVTFHILGIHYSRTHRSFHQFKRACGIILEQIPRVILTAFKSNTNSHLVDNTR